MHKDERTCNNITLFQRQFWQIHFTQWALKQHLQRVNMSCWSASDRNLLFSSFFASHKHLNLPSKPPKMKKDNVFAVYFLLCVSCFMSSDLVCSDRQHEVKTWWVIQRQSWTQIVLRAENMKHYHGGDCRGHWNHQISLPPAAFCCSHFSHNLNHSRTSTITALLTTLERSCQVDCRVG